MMNIFIFKTIKVRSFEMGLNFRDGEFRGLLGQGRHWFVDPLGKVKVEVVSLRTPWLAHEKLDMIVRSGALRDRAVVLDLKDYERALVWIDGRFSHILPPGLYAYWTALKDVKVEVVDARRVRFEHADLKVIMQSPQVERVLELGDGAGAPRRRVVYRWRIRGDIAAGPLCLLEEHGASQVRPGGPARGDVRRGRPGHHDGRQGDIAHECRRHLPRSSMPGRR